MHYVTIQNQRVPALGFGTWKLEGDACVQAVRAALDLGYRHIDTARDYRNEAEVGRALAESRVPRPDIFLVTKIYPQYFAPDDFIASARDSLLKLRTDYLDLLLLHWPSPDIPIDQTLSAARRLLEAGQIRHLGVSNFPPSLAARACALFPIFCNQVEYHPYLSQHKLLAQARDLDYLLTAYSPLAKGEIHRDPVLLSLGQRYHKTPAQIALRWFIQQDHVAVIPKAASPEHLRQNLDIFDFELTAAEMQQIHQLDRNYRSINPGWFSFPWER